jgi:hypothetical protein
MFYRERERERERVCMCVILNLFIHPTQVQLHIHIPKYKGKENSTILPDFLVWTYLTFPQSSSLCEFPFYFLFFLW